MSGLYNSNFSPVRAASPQIRTNPEVDRYSYSTSTLQLGCFNYASSESIQLNCFCFCFFFFSQYLTELLAEHQKLGPFMQALPICTRLLNQGFFLLEICRSPFSSHFTSNFTSISPSLDYKFKTLNRP